MNPLVFFPLLAAAGPMRFERHEIDAFPAGYQVAVADMNGDGKPDVIALSTDANRVDWYENPTWKRHPVARTPRNIDLAVRTINGRPAIALASGFYFDQSNRGGEIELLTPPEKPDELWTLHPVGVDPVVHRLRWGDLDGDGRAELIYAPIFGRGSDATRDPKPAHLWAYRVPDDLDQGRWPVWKIDESLTVLHGLYVGDLDGDGRDEILTASFEGIHRFEWKGQGPAVRWHKTQLSTGAAGGPEAGHGTGQQRNSARPFRPAPPLPRGDRAVAWRPGGGLYPGGQRRGYRRTLAAPRVG